MGAEGRQFESDRPDQYKPFGFNEMPWHRLKSYWRDQGVLSPVPGVDDIAIEEFERRYSVQMPSDLRLYFRQLNGMDTSAGHDFDEHGYGFLPLSGLRTVGAFTATMGWSVEKDQIGFGTAFVFINYFQWTCAYAVETAGKNAGAVYLLGYPKARIVASSFSNFVEQYLVDDPSLYEPPAI